jgi:hypothetical protein
MKSGLIADKQITKSESVNSRVAENCQKRALTAGVPSQRHDTRYSFTLDFQVLWLEVNIHTHCFQHTGICFRAPE